MMNEVAYGTLSTAYYDATKPIGTEIDGDLTYYCERLQDVTGPILEAGVGTGRLLIPLAKRGFQMEGIDQSASMLARCRMHCERHGVLAPLYQGNIASMTLRKKFAAIMMPTGSFGLIEEDPLQTLQTLYEHLEGGGRLLFDCSYPTSPSEAITSTVELDERTDVTMHMSASTIHYASQYVHTHLTYEQYVDGIRVATEHQPFTVRWYGVRELTYMLRHVGFTSWTFTSNYDREKPIDAQTTLLTVEAIRT